MLKVKDFLGTIYVCEHHVIRDLNNIDEDVDICDCRISEAAEGWINNMQSRGFNIIDSNDIVRDAILKENKKRQDIYKKRLDGCMKPLPALEKFEDITAVINSLKKDVVYQSGMQNNDLDIEVYLTILIMIMRPEIIIDITSNLKEILTIIHKSLYAYGYAKIINHCDTWYIASMYSGKMSISKEHITEKDLDKPFKFKNQGNVTWQYLVDYKFAFPANLSIKEPYWKELCTSICSLLKEALDIKNRTLMQFLEE